MEPQSGHPSPKILHRGDKLPCLLRNAPRQTGLEKPGFYLQEVLMWWLANNQGRESLALVAATLIHFPIQRGKHPSPAPSTLQLGMRSHEIWAKTWSSHAETDRGTWGMIQVEPRKPLSVHPPGGRWGLSGHRQYRQEHRHKALGSSALDLRQRAPGEHIELQRDSWRA